MVIRKFAPLNSEEPFVFNLFYKPLDKSAPSWYLLYDQALWKNGEKGAISTEYEEISRENNAEQRKTGGI